MKGNSKDRIAVFSPAVQQRWKLWLRLAETALMSQRGEVGRQDSCLPLAEQLRVRRMIGQASTLVTGCRTEAWEKA